MKIYNIENNIDIENEEENIMFLVNYVNEHYL